VDIVPDDAEEEFTALTGADFPRVDLVSRPANGAKGFFVMKQDASAGLMPADMVRDLIAKTSPEEAPVPRLAEAGEATLPNGIVIKGSPAAMAAFIHAANVRKAEEPEPDAEPEAPGVAKAEMSTGSVNDLDDDQFGYIEPGGKKDEQGKTTPRSLRHFPLNDAPHVRNALSRAPQSPFGDKAMPKIRAAAKRFKIDVAKEAGVADQVTKDMMDAAGDAMALDDGTDGMDPAVPLAAPGDEMEIPGDPTDPGSPAWEAIDAATAQKWLSIAARLKNALCLLAEREMLEAASADPDDAENAWNLQDAACAVDFAIEQLAVFASGEQAEAEIGAEMAEMCKALAGFDAAPLGVIEGLTAVAKAGRVLSAQNESAIRAAAESLQKVLASLPEAPIAKEKEGTVPNHTIDMRGREMAQGAAAETLARPGPVAKAAPAEDQARDTGPVNAGGTTGMGAPRQTGPDAALPGDGPQEARPGDAPGRTVVKSALPVAVWDASRRFLGLTRPERIVQQVAKAGGDDGGKTTMQAVFDEDGNLVGIVDPADITPVAGAGGGSGDDSDGGDGMQAGPAAAAAPAGDDNPQPPADAGTPADAVGKGAEENVITATPADLDSIIAKAVAAALGAVAPAEDVAKQADVAGALAEVELLKARLAVVEETPAAPKVFTNGAVPPASQLRGQDQGASNGTVDVTKALERKGQLYSAPDARAQNEIAKSMQADAISVLSAIHGSRPEPVRA
jgi:hypothetical protein